MEQNSLKTEEFSVLHDAELCLVSMDRENGKLQLGFRGVDRTIYLLSFERIITFRINNIQYQNVVSGALLFGVSKDFYEDLERVVKWICSGSEENLLISEKNLRDYIAKVRSGDLQLLYVDPSWGAEIGVIAENVSMSVDAQG